MFIVLLNFSSSLATKCLCLNDEPCMVRPSLIDLNPVELKYYPFMISLDKCHGSFIALSPKICVSKKTKEINVKVFNIITNTNEAKKWQNKFHAIANANSILELAIQIKKGIIDYVNVSVKILVNAENVIVGILAHVFVRMIST